MGYSMMIFCMRLGIHSIETTYTAERRSTQIFQGVHLDDSRHTWKHVAMTSNVRKWRQLSHQIPVFYYPRPHCCNMQRWKVWKTGPAPFEVSSVFQETHQGEAWWASSANTVLINAGLLHSYSTQYDGEKKDTFQRSCWKDVDLSPGAGLSVGVPLPDVNMALDVMVVNHVPPENINVNNCYYYCDACRVSMSHEWF